jgi:membrane-bound lytic murein transglycosylase D
MPPPFSVRVTYPSDSGTRVAVFKEPFRIGRLKGCDVCIDSEFVSRSHADVILQDERWWVRDLQSSNGIYVGDERIEAAAVGESLTIRLGVSGPQVLLEIESPPVLPVLPAGDESRFADRYFSEADSGESAGEHTMMIRRAFQRVQTRQRRKYRWVIATLVLAVMAAAGSAVYLEQKASANREFAQRLFYSMKAVDLNIARIENVVNESNSVPGQAEVRKLQSQRREMEEGYDRLLTALKIYDPKITERERLILRVARIFGESEISMPPEFAAEVGRYIQMWQSSNRLGSALAAAKEKGYDRFITQELLARDLPPQFFYLALQESGFDTWAVGPSTRKGYAKGMWQFIPETGAKYSLRIGPLVDFPRSDPGDDRQHYDLATKAAAHYLKDLYSSDAQASGLLVMACYNWGDERVLPLVRSMPADPRERNFWRFLAKYRDRMPTETYNYVFSIFSAAVIGENPRLFGFRFDNPLLQ